MTDELTMFQCGGPLCSSGDGKPCDDDGPGVKWESGGSVNCSRCGQTALDRAMWADWDES
jgi:hypothetical protein